MAYYKMVNGKLTQVSSLTNDNSNKASNTNLATKPTAMNLAGGAVKEAANIYGIADKLNATKPSGAESAISAGANAAAQAKKVSDATNVASSGLSAGISLAPQQAVVETPKSANPFSFNPYSESQSVIDARNALNNHVNNRVGDWTGGTYGQALQSAMDRILNRDKFSYDLNGDALYQQYKDQYINQGRLAMNDTIGQASAMTGGYGNSYAATAGNQAYQGYLQKLNDVVPELYQMAYDKYSNEGKELYNQYNMYNNAYNDEYGRYRDQVADWNNEYNRLSDAYYNEANRDYNMYSDNYDRAFGAYKQNLANDQYAKELAMKQAELNAKLSGSSGSGNGNENKSETTTKLPNAKGYSDQEYMDIAKRDENKDVRYGKDVSYYSQVVEDIRDLSPEKAKDYIKTQWSNGNLTDTEYQMLYNKLRG